MLLFSIEVVDALGECLSCGVDIFGANGPAILLVFDGVSGYTIAFMHPITLRPAGMGDVAIYTELGRFMMGPYGCLVTKAINEKHTYKEYIGVDACAVNLMRPAMYGAYHHITVMGKEDQPCDHMYDVTGSLCENNDKFAIDRDSKIYPSDSVEYYTYFKEYRQKYEIVKNEEHMRSMEPEEVE